MNIQDKIAWVVSPERHFPPDMRLGRLFGNRPFEESVVSYVEILRESQFWPRDVLEYIQLERLKRLTNHISRHSPMWADFLKGHGFSPDSPDAAQMLRPLPVLDRRTLLEWGDRAWVLTENQKDNVLTRHTSGTGGFPMKLLVDQGEFIIALLTYRFRHPAFNAASLTDLFRRKCFVALGLPGGRHAFVDFTHHIFHPLTLSDLAEPSTRRRIYETIEAAGPVLLAGYASLLLAFAKGVAQDNVHLPLLAVVLSSEGISLADRMLVSRDLRAPITNMISTNETRNIGFECPENMGRFHANSERIILEVVDDQGAALPDGQEGHFVVTVLDHTVTPIIRYAINDTGRMVPGYCPCGRTLPLFEIYGRRESQLKLPSGRAVRVLYLHDALKEIDGFWAKAIQFQVRQESLDHLRLLVIPQSPFSRTEEANIRSCVTELCFGEELEIDIEYVETIPTTPGGKPQIFVPLKAG